MVLRMAGPFRRPGSAIWWFRKRIPANVLRETRGTSLHLPIGSEVRPVSVSDKAVEIICSLRTHDHSEARSRHTAVSYALEGYWQALREGPKLLSLRDAVALAGEAYRIWMGLFEDDPVNQDIWAREAAICRAILEEDSKPPVTRWGVEVPQIRKAPSGEERFGFLADRVLTERSMVVSGTDREKLVREIVKAIGQAAEQLVLRAGGDYRADPNAGRFPALSIKDQSSSGAIRFAELLEGWWAEAKARGLVEKTRSEYTRTLKRLEEHLGHDDAARVTPADIVSFKAYRIAQGRSVKTVNAGDLVAFKAVFGWAERNLLLPVNPAEKIKVDRERKTRAGVQSISNAEARAILTAARDFKPSKRTSSHRYLGIRWVPWLCAYSGARVGEMVQLRKEDIREADGVHYMMITPDAGNVKSKAERIVPLHAHLIEQGFLNVVTSAAAGFLFCNPKSTARNDVEAAKGTAKNRLTEWVRTAAPGLKVMPNHGWRHRFKTLAREHDIAERSTNMLVGHGAKTVGDAYGDDWLTLIKAIQRFPRQGE